MDCCSVYADEFGRDAALADAQRYRRRGLDRVTRAVRDRILDDDVTGMSVLEVGGGVGALSIELLTAGASSAVNVELSSSYRDAGTALALEAGLEDRLQFVVADGADFAARSGGFDIVVLNRVVCCYEEAGALLEAASIAARQRLVLSHPTIHPLARLVVGIGNLLRARRGSPFRTFVHPADTLGRPGKLGFEATGTRSRPVWTVRSWNRIDSSVGATGPI